MPEIKKQFTGGKMNKDLDERLVPNGEYRHAMNIQVSTSEGSDVGTVQNVLGNDKGCSSSFSSPNSFTVGSISDEKNDTLYWLVSGNSGQPGTINGNDSSLQQAFAYDYIARLKPSQTLGGSKECELVFVDTYGFSVSNINVLEDMPSLQVPLTTIGSIETGWTVYGLNSENGETSSIATITSTEQGTTVIAEFNYETSSTGVYTTTYWVPSGGFSSPNHVQGGLYLPLQIDADGVASQAIGSTVYIYGYIPTGSAVQDLVGDTIQQIGGGLFPGGTTITDVESMELDMLTPAANVAGAIGAAPTGGGYANNQTTPVIRLTLSQNINSIEDLPSTPWDGYSDYSGEGVLASSYDGFRFNFQTISSTLTYNQSQTNEFSFPSQVDLQVGDVVEFPSSNQAACVGSIGAGTGDNVFLVYCGTNNPFLPSTSNPYATSARVTVGGINGNLATITLDQSVTIYPEDYDFLVFKGPRVLNFNHNNHITGINIVDDMLFWTDNLTEPKKINIPRSFAGTTQNTYFNLPTDLVINGVNKGRVKEEHLTVIRKAPSKAPSLLMERDRAGLDTADFTLLNLDSSGIVLGGKTWAVRDVAGSPNYIVGDVIFFTVANVQGGIRGTILEIQREGYEYGGEVVSSSGEIAFLIEIISFPTEALNAAAQTAAEWNGVLEDDDKNLFERKFSRFAYRYKYVDNEYSSIGPFTEVAFLPGNFKYHGIEANNTGMTNRIKSLSILDFVPTDIPKDVVQVDILYKNETDPTIYIIDSITENAEPITGQPTNHWYALGSGESPTGRYDISSENIYAALPSSQSLRSWDNVPKTALAQEVTGNRLVYGNYTQNYNLDSITPNIEVALGTKSNANDENYGKRSIKSLRNYELGVVWGDKYGRETPVIAPESGTIIVPKSRADQASYIQADLKNSPEWAEYYKFYIKETSNEYYNLAMDRYYGAEDGNIWCAFPSVDRNKVDEETYLILKKGIDEDNLITDAARYKIVAIENEAPDFIKTMFSLIARSNVDGSKTLDSCTMWGGTYDAATGLCSIESSVQPPAIGFKYFTLHSDTWVGEYSGAQTRQMGLPSPVDLLKEVSANSDQDQLWVSFSKRTVGGGGAIKEEYSTKYRVIGVDGEDEDVFTIKLAESIKSIDENYTSSGPDYGLDGLHVHFWKRKLENKPEFDGRFFVKIRFDEVARDAFEKTPVFIKNWQISKSFPLHSVSDISLNQGPSSASGHSLRTTAGSGDSSTRTRDQWRSLLKFGTGTRASRWFIDKTSFAGVQNINSSNYKTHARWYVNPTNGSVSSTSSPGFVRALDDYSQQDISFEFYTWALGNSSISVTDFVNIFSGYGSNTDIDNVGDGRSFGRIGMGGVFEDGAVKYFDLGFSQVNPSGTGGKDYNPYLDWNVGSDSNPSHDEEEGVVSRLTTNQRFRFQDDTDKTIFVILSVQKRRLYNYQGGITTKLDNARAGVRYHNMLHVSQTNDIVESSNRRTSYRVSYEAVESENPGTLADLTIADVSCYGSATRTDFTNIQFLNDFSSEGDTEISNNPAIFETEPKEDNDLNLYYEASSNLATLPLTNNNKYTYIPIGSVLIEPTTLSSTTTLFPTGVFVSNWVGLNRLKLSAPLDQDEYMAISSTSPTNRFIEFQKDNGDVVSVELIGSITEEINGDIVVVELEINPVTKVGLSWFNCWSFGNGVESNRIGDTFNKPYVTNGAIVSSTLDEPYQQENRKYGMIYSGIYNANSTVNNLNQFISAEKITKDINPTYGSIQKLHSGWGQNGDLIALCEDRVLKILANKDALFNADGNPQLISTNSVLGQATPYSGEYGISKNPESFASEAYRIYFTDKIRGAVMRLSMDGLTPISDHGMKDWFRDNLRLSPKLIGSHDNRKNEYNLSLSHTHDANIVAGATVTFREDVKGWVSFKSFVTENGVSCANDYYTFNKGELWKHHAQKYALGVENNRNTFYSDHTDSSFSVLLNDAPGSVKSFKTLNYEGTDSRIKINTEDGEYYNLNEKKGWYVNKITTNLESGSLNEFIKKEGKWFNYIKGKDISHNPATGAVNTSGSGKFDQASFSIQGLGIPISSITTISISLIGCTNPTATNYNSDATTDDGSCIMPTYGCMVVEATNYSSSANTDDGSCIIEGCTDPTAFNYNALANTDDGSCIALVLGCMDDTMFNYDGLANADNNGTYLCVPYNYGCNVVGADNYNPDVNTHNEECIWAGCSNSLATNYSFGNNAEATAYPTTGGFGIQDNGTCQGGGCIDEDAGNYDPLATIDNSTCYFCSDFTTSIANGYDGNPFSVTTVHEIILASSAFTYSGKVIVTVNTQAPFEPENWLWTLVDSNGVQSPNHAQGYAPTVTGQNPLEVTFVNTAPGTYTLTAIANNYASSLGQGYGYNGWCSHAVEVTVDAVVSGCTNSSATNYNAAANTDDGSCIYISGCTDATANNYDALASVYDGSCTYDVLGCTDSTAANYDPLANIDNGSCEDVANGCMDSTMFNYNPLANVDDGTCIAVLEGCTDPTAFNYNVPPYTANTDDGSCIYPGCTNANADNYDALATLDDASCVFIGCNVRPQLLTITNVTSTTATLSWEASSPNMNGYHIRIRVVGALWNTFVSYQLSGTNSTSINITGLYSSTQYEWQIQAFCDNATDTSLWTPTNSLSPLFQNKFTTNPPTGNDEDETDGSIFG